MFKRTSSLLCISVFALFGADSTLLGQTSKVKSPISFQPGTKVISVAISPEHRQKILAQAAAGQTVPLWNYSVVSPIDGNTYTGSMIGRDPGFNANGFRTTPINFYLVPLILKFPASAGGMMFDPTAPNACNLDNNGNQQSSLFLVEHSPEFVAAPITMNGVSEGTVEYTDAFQRASFQTTRGAAGAPYHYALNLIVAAAQTVNVPASWSPGTYNNGCGNEGEIDEPSVDAYMQNTGIPAVTGAGTNSIIMFLTDSIIETIGGQPYSSGYHTAYFPNGVMQVYGITEWDSALGTANTGNGCQTCADIGVTSHEIAELTDDPTAGNPAPSWGHIGQVTACQADVEVGDPLSYVNFTGITLSNFTYHPQELAFFSWFMRQTPSLGAGGKYSDNGTFTTDAGAVCQ